MRVLSFQKLYSAKPRIGSQSKNGKEMCGKKLPTKEEEQKVKAGEVVLATYSLFPPKHLYRLSGLVPPCWEISGKIPAGKYLGSPAGEDTIGQDTGQRDTYASWFTICVLMHEINISVDVATGFSGLPGGNH